jgi:hypothetical protein
LNLLKTNNKQGAKNFIIFPRTCNPHYNYPLFLSACFVLLIATIIFGSINSSATLFAAAKEQEITEENILSKISLATQWLAEQQRGLPNNSGPTEAGL